MNSMHLMWYFGTFLHNSYTKFNRINAQKTNGLEVGFKKNVQAVK